MRVLVIWDLVILCVEWLLLLREGFFNEVVMGRVGICLLCQWEVEKGEGRLFIFLYVCSLDRGYSFQKEI